MEEMDPLEIVDILLRPVVLFHEVYYSGALFALSFFDLGTEYVNTI